MSKGPMTYHAREQGLIITSTADATDSQHAKLLLRAVAEVAAVELPTGAVGKHREVRRVLSKLGVGVTIVGEVIETPVKPDTLRLAVRDELRRVGRTQADLAREIQWSEKQLSQVMTGRRHARLDAWEEILDGLGLSLRLARREGPEEAA